MHNATMITFFFYLLIVFLIGYAAYRVTRNVSDFVLGGRRLSGPVAALSAGASDMSGWLLLGLPGVVYANGLSESWIGLGLALGAYFNWLLVAPRLRQLSGRYKAITLPEYLDRRFEDPHGILRVAAAVITLIFFTLYIAAGMVAGATLFEKSFQLEYEWALYLGSVIIVSYTFFGGFLAVSWTDFFQGILMLLALVVTPLAALISLGGWEDTGQRLLAAGPDHLSPFTQLTAIGFISLMAWGLGYFGQPHLLVRFMAIKHHRSIPGARRIAMAWMIASLAGAILVGLMGFAYFAGKPEAALLSETGGNAEAVFILLTQAVLNPWVAGILLAAILSAVMSTIDSQLLVSSSAITEDLYRRFSGSGPEDGRLVTLGRLAVLVIAVLALVIAHDRESRVLALVSYAWAGLGAAFGPIILVSLFWKKMTWQGALLGLITGAVTVVIWKNLSGGLFDLYELFPGFLFALFAIVAGSRFFPRSVPTDVEHQFNNLEG